MQAMKRILLSLLILLVLTGLTGCRRRIVDNRQADVVIVPSQSEEPDRPEDPAETESPTETEAPTETVAPTEPPEPSQADHLPTEPPTADAPPDDSLPLTPGVPDSTASAAQPPSPEPTEPTQPAEPRYVTVTLEPQRGLCQVQTLELQVGQPFGPLPPAGREGYFFTGWYLSRFGGTAVDADTIVTQVEDFTLYAHWTAQSACTLFLDPNGGRLHPSDGQRTVYVGSTIGTLPQPLREGYDFLGWFTEREGGEALTGETVFNGTTDLTLYAQWAYNPFAFWSFTLENIRQQMYSCQELSVYVEFDTPNVTVAYCSLLEATKCQNAAQYREEMTVTDEWVMERNPAVICKIVSDMGSAAAIYSEMTARFPGKRVLVVPAAAVYGNESQMLYYQLLFGKTLYPDWYQAVEPAVVGAELGVDGSLYG